ncbi:MAG: aerobic carbon-monoxide dehydrogenase large subunit, partial [Pseudonocardiales bacterium]|nr:aerobic carbon-monoxide dehydrogenase large subunit [Pseudonocardiales bacterium]
MSEIGRSVPRLEDNRLLRGRGRFHDNTHRPGQLWMRVVRSPVAHGRIRGIRTVEALASPGVVDVVTAADLPAKLRIPVRQGTPGVDFSPYLQAPLAESFVRYVGDPVAVVVADDPYLAEDAAELVLLDIEELPPALDARSSAALHLEAFDGAPAEVAVIESGYGDVDSVFTTAAHVVTAQLRTGRQTGTPLETRGLIAEWDDREERLTIWGAAKVPYFNRRITALMLGLAEHQIHMFETDAGGSFGIRGEFYPEDLLVPFLALRTGRPVKWVEDRVEHLLAANHAREQEHHLELAFDAEYQMIGLRDEAWLDNGGYIRTHGAVVAVLTAAMMSGPYRLPAMRTRVHIVLTNKTPIGTYRAPGRFQNNFVREHLMDVAAGELGIDPIELRRRNLLDASELPMERPMRVFGSPMLLDGSDHLGHFERSLATVGYEDWRREAAEARAAGHAVGTGCAVILEKAGLGYDSAVVSIDATGAVRVAMGGSSSGQGIETVMAQIAADAFGISAQAVKVVLSDTDILPDGAGTFGSRSTVVGGTAVQMAAEAVLHKARRVAGQLLGRDPADLVVDGGRLVAADDPNEWLSFARIAAECFTPAQIQTGSEPGLVGRGTFVADGMTYPYGVHYCQVAVDRETGEVRVTRYAMSYEIGRVVNPRMAIGQLVGGAVQGIGGALSEELLFDPKGMPLVQTLGDYRWPRAADVPDIEVHLFEDSPSPG